MQVECFYNETSETYSVHVCPDRKFKSLSKFRTHNPLTWNHLIFIAINLFSTIKEASLQRAM